MKKDRASRAKEAYAVFDKFSAVSVNWQELVKSYMGPRVGFQTHLVATCFYRHRLAKFGKADERLVDAPCRLGCQREA